MSDFSVTVRSRGPVQVLDLAGELDAHTTAELEDTLQQCQDDGHHRLVINGEALDYISSAGLGVFMAYIEEMRAHGGDIKIAGLQPKVHDVFDLLGFPMLFDIVETEDEAVEQFEQSDADPSNVES